MTSDVSPRIYVASLSDYNAGTLHGCWIDAAQETEAIYADIQHMLSRSPERWTCQWCGYNTNNIVNIRSHDEHEDHVFLPGNAEEWAIHDYEGFGSLRLSEYESIERVSQIALAIEDCDEPDAMAGWLSLDSDNDPDEFSDHYRGKFDSFREFVEAECMDIGWGTLTAQQLDENYSVIDWDHITHEYEISGGFSTVNAKPYGVYVFSDYV